MFFLGSVKQRNARLVVHITGFVFLKMRHTLPDDGNERISKLSTLEPLRQLLATTQKPNYTTPHHSICGRVKKWCPTSERRVHIHQAMFTRRRSGSLVAHYSIAANVCAGVNGETGSAYSCSHMAINVNVLRLRTWPLTRLDWEVSPSSDAVKDSNSSCWCGVHTRRT